MKRLLSILLCTVLLLTTTVTKGNCVSVSSDEITAVEAAERLHDLGLFQGTITGRFDEESMALDRTATRTEALVMFLRLLGREETIKSGTWNHDFTDVANWASPYVGYAYKNGLSNGIGGGLFGAGRTTALNDYVTFLLRALGYNEKNGDFTWNIAPNKGMELGLYHWDFISLCANGMTRGQLALVSYAALSQPLKDNAQTLAGSLVDAGVVDNTILSAQDISLLVLTDAEMVLKLTNQLRADAGMGLGSLVLDEELSALAQIRAQETTSLFEHVRPDGRDCFTVLSDNHFSFRTCGENIAMGYFTAESVMEGWANSPGHYENIICSDFSRLGVGRVGNYWVQLFAD